MIKVEIESRRARTAERSRRMRNDQVLAVLERAAAAVQRAIEADAAGDYSAARRAMEEVPGELRTESWYLVARGYQARISGVYAAVQVSGAVAA